jgi:tripartite-type tricarboxylate transporter receptor subunit TctC
MNVLRHFQLGCAATLFALCSAMPASAESAWPSHPIHFIVAAPAGSSLDVIARSVGEALRERLGQPVVVDNRPSAGGTTGTDAVAKAAPDGYTWLLSFNGPLAFAPTLYASLPYDPLRDLTPVILTSSQPNVLAVNHDLPVKNVAELLAYARAHPGKLNYASVGNGSSSHLTMELLKSAANLDIVHVPYNGAPPAVLAVAANDAQMLFAVPTAMLPQLSSGKLVALAVSGRKRYALMPQLPTLAESGFADFESLAWNGIMLPAGTSPAIVERLNHEVNAVLALPSIRARLKTAGLEPAGGSAAEFAGLIRAESAKWAPVIKRTGARVD